MTKEATAALMKNPAVANVVAFSGFDLLSRALKTNSGISFVTLKDWSVRNDPKEDARKLAPALSALNADFKDGSCSASTRRRSRASAPPAASSSTSRTVGRLARRPVGGGQQGGGRRQQRPELRGVSTTFTTAVPQYRTDVDRDKARALGMPINAIFDTMRSTIGSLYVNDFTMYGRT